MTPEEIEFEKKLESIGADTVSCVTHAYQELAFHHIAGSDPEVFRAVNTKAGFFKAMLSGHQTAAFISMHRLYETEPDHESVASLLHYAQLNLQIFSKERLALRKQGQGMTAEGAATFVGDAFVPDERGFAEIREACARSRELYEEKARPIRHKVFAHTGTLRLADRVRQFESLMVRDFERLAVFPYVMHRAMKALFVDGYRPTLDAPETNIVPVVASPPPDRHTTYLHFHIAKETSEFLTEFTRMTLSDLQDRGVYHREHPDGPPPEQTA
jgi:hypothetical protein